MQFAQPLWLLAGAAVCALLVWQFRRYDRAQRASLAKFAAERLLPNLTSSVSTPRRRVKRTLFMLGIVLTFVALARPQVGFEWQETHRKGLEILFAVDTSKSMLAQDVKPDRLTRAKLAVTDLVAKLQGDGVGLIAFAGSAFLQCPVTLDYDAFRESLDALDMQVIPHGGSDLAAAIREGEAVFKTRTSAEKILVLITDGEDLGGEGIAAAAAAAKNGVKIFTVGVGGAAGELVPVPGPNGGTEFARDEHGELVKSQLDEESLRKIAEATGGMYQSLGIQGEGLTTIYDQGLAEFTRQDLSSRQTKVPLERFHWALLAALACFMSELLVGNRRRTKGQSGAGLRRATVALALMAGAAGTQAATPQTAEEAYRNGDFTKSHEEYAATVAEDPENPELQFNAGSAAYKTGDYAQAADGFQRSLQTEEVPVQQRAYYNLGNTQYRLGQKTEAENPQETIKTWEEAVKSYDAALQIAPEDAEAKHNRDLVQRKIDELKQQQEEQKKQDQQNQEDQQDQSQDQGGDSEEQQSDSQDSESGDKNQDSQDPQGGSGEPKDDAQNDKGGSKDPKDESESKSDQGDQPENRKGENEPKAEADPGKGDEKKDEADNSRNARSAQDKQEPQQADAESGQGEQPKPVNPSEKPSQGEAEAAHGEESDDGQQASAAAPAQEPRVPGEMTTEEARQLLDALKGDERRVPAISAQGNAAGVPNENAILKDW